MMIKDLFVLNPDDNNLVNDGVVNINTAKDESGLKTIRHELRTFVCEGEYQKGIHRILSTYLKYLDQPKQPAVWVSGFFGSGKSHLIKMLAYYWEDFQFPGGETARTIKTLPEDIREQLVELDRKQKAHGKLAIRGTLKDFPSDDIRYSFLQLMLTALQLPQQYHHFKFVHWANQEGILQDMKGIVESQDKNFDKELENLFVSSSLAKAVLQLRPEFAQNEAKVKEAFREQFRRVERIDRRQLLSTIKEEVLPMSFGEKIPCTIVVLDELQQFIGQDGSKTLEIQNLAQDICDHLDGKFLLVGSGQNALNETPQLSPLKDRFSVTVALSDTDVETVTRKTVLEKKASALGEITKGLESWMGEISRNLDGTSFGFNTGDKVNLAADYPIMPSTRKFWKKMLQVIDTAGTSGQLRSQLRIVDESLKKVADRKLGAIVPADWIFEQKQQQLLQNAILLQETNNMIMERKAKGGDGLLEGRILSVVFLIDHLPKDLPGGPIVSNEKTIADLLLDDISQSGDGFRNKVKTLVQKLVEQKVLMPVGDEYKLQTKVGQEWEQEYTSHAIKFNNSGEDQIQRLRRDSLVANIRSRTKGLSILHGASKMKREFEIYDRMERPSTESKLHVWIRDGWNESESVLMNEIRSEGTSSPLAYVFINKFRDQDLRSEIVKYLAAEATLNAKGIPTSPEGEQVRKSMETRKALAWAHIGDLAETICKEAKVYLAGGAPVDGGTLPENIREALNALADRQFPDFKNKADFPDWDKALSQALANNPEALKKVKYNGDVKDHPVAIDILRFMGSQAKQGREMRNHFMKAPYGWSQDAVDAMLVMLKLTDHLSCPESNLKVGNINGSTFKRETHTLSASDKIKLRKLFSDTGSGVTPGEEFAGSNSFLRKLVELAGTISGEKPLPEALDTTFIKDLENLDGNERLIRMVEQIEDLRDKHAQWTKMAAVVEKRMPNWNLIAALRDFLPIDGNKLLDEIDGLKDGRHLLQEPDPVASLLDRVTKDLNNHLHDLKVEFNRRYDEQMAALQANEYFSKLTPEQKHTILVKHQVVAKPEVKPADAQGLINQLQKVSLDAWKTRISALPTQFQACIDEAIALLAPKAEFYSIPRRTLRTDAEVDAYVDEVKKEMKELMKKSSSIIIK